MFSSAARLISPIRNRPAIVRLAAWYALAWLAATSNAVAAAVDWRLLGEWSGSGSHAGFVVTFAADGGYVIAQDGIPSAFGSYAVDGRQILFFPGGAGEFPERGAYGFSGTDRLFIMTHNFGRSEWQRLTPMTTDGEAGKFEYNETSADDRSSFEKAVEKLEKLSSSLEAVERKLDGDGAGNRDAIATAESSGKKRSMFDRMKDAARKTAGSAGNLSRKAARSIKAAGDAWKDDDKDAEKESEPASTEVAAETPPPVEAAPVVNPMLGGATAPTGTNSTVSGMAGGISAFTPPSAATVQQPAPQPGVAVDAALAQRAMQLAAKWQPDASLVEIVAHVGADGSVDVSAPPQAVSLWFASPSAPGNGLMMSLAPDGSFVSAPALRSAATPSAPASFIAVGQAIHAARSAGLQGETFRAALRVVPGSEARSFGWIVAPASGSGEIIVDAVTGQPLR